MGKLIMNGKEVEVGDGDPIKDAAEELGVPFGCENGVCSTCEIKVVEGMENLSPVNDKENAIGLATNHRLACQCKLKTGNVKISEP